MLDQYFSPITAASIAAAQVLSVANIDSPGAELNLRAGSVNGALCLVTQNIAGANAWTLYAFDSASSAGVSSPYIVAALTSGQWIAVAGKYVNSGLNVAGATTFTAGTASTTTTTGTLVVTGGVGVSGQVSAATLLVSGIISGRVPYASTGGLFTSATNFGYDAATGLKAIGTTNGGALTTSDAGTTNVTDTLGCHHRSSAGAAAGFGSAFNIACDSSSNALRNVVTMRGEWIVATDASRTGRATFQVYDTAAREFMRADASGSAAMIGFLGATAVVRPASTADLRQALIDLGLYTTGGATPLNLNGGAFATSGVATVGSTTAPTGVFKLRIDGSTTTTNSLTDSSGAYLFDGTMSTRCTTSATIHNRAFSFAIAHGVDAAQTNSGGQTGAWFEAFRNYSIGTADGGGTLTTLTGFQLNGGHFNTAAVSPVTTTANIVSVGAYYMTGTIGTLTGLNLNMSAGTGGTVTNKYGINIGNVSGAATLNYSIFTGTGIVSFGDTTASTTTTTGGVLVGGGLGVAGRINAGGEIVATSSTNPTRLVLSDSATNTTPSAFQFEHQTSGTPAAGFGVSVDTILHSSNNTRRVVMSLTSSWVVATDATRTSRTQFYALDTGFRECFRIEASGTAPMFGMYGTAATIQYATTGTSTGFTAGAGTTATHLSTFTGNTGASAYTVGDIVRALKLVGLMAA